MNTTILDVRGDIGGQYDHSTRPTRLNELFVDSWVMLGRNSDTEIDRGRFRELRPHLLTEGSDLELVDLRQMGYFPF